jgi:hypothetical protein
MIDIFAETASILAASGVFGIGSDLWMICPVAVWTS